MVRGSLAAAAAALLILATPALAQDPAPTPTPAPPAATPAPSPAPAKGKLKIRVRAPLHNHGRSVALLRDRVRVDGMLTPPLRGQTLIVRVKLRGRSVFAKRVHAQARGRFKLRLPLRRPGSVTIEAVHRATKALATTRSKPRRVLVLRPRAAIGAHGTLVRMLQAGLAREHYAIARTGIFDAATARAVMAWRKVNQRVRLMTADEPLVRAVLAGHGAYRVRYPHSGHHVEADLSRQVLALVDGRRLSRVYTISSGKPSTPTVQGTFHVYSKSPGTNEKGMVDTSYFYGAYGIHGYFDVPPYAASHGCLRVPIADARTIFNWVRYGDTVIVEP